MKVHTGMLGFHCIHCRDQFASLNVLKIHLSQKECLQGGSSSGTPSTAGAGTWAQRLGQTASLGSDDSQFTTGDSQFTTGDSQFTTGDSPFTTGSSACYTMTKSLFVEYKSSVSTNTVNAPRSPIGIVSRLQLAESDNSQSDQDQYTHSSNLYSIQENSGKSSAENVSSEVFKHLEGHDSIGDG